MSRVSKNYKIQLSREWERDENQREWQKHKYDPVNTRHRDQGEITKGITKVKQGSQHRPGNSEGKGIQSTHVIGIKGKLRRDP